MKENIVPATCMAEGSYDEAVYCAVCGEELARNQVTVPVDPDAHAWGAWEPLDETNEKSFMFVYGCDNFCIFCCMRIRK